MTDAVTIFSISHLLESRGIALLFAVFIYGAMFAISAAIASFGKAKSLTAHVENRVGALDGLRGVLALGVFICHCVVFYRWQTTGIWDTGPNSVVYHLGATSVALFFMITGFLFTRKSMGRNIQWSSFYRDRLGRLGPLYFMIVGVICAIVFIASDGALREDPLQLVAEVFKWLAFGAFGRPDINGYDGTWHIIAGVNWSLQYEVIFYAFAVPALYWINQIVTPLKALMITLLSIAALIFLYRATGHVYIDFVYAMHFLGGIAVAFAYSVPAARRISAIPLYGWVGAAAATSLFFMPDNQSAKAVIVSILIFGSVVGGASVFGLLKTRAAIWLGDISYGIYLLHGLMLWLGYQLIQPPMSPWQFVLFALVVGALVVGLATISYLYLELPTMAYVKARRGRSGPVTAS